VLNTGKNNSAKRGSCAVTARAQSALGTWSASEPPILCRAPQ
jgi:hypothetical protein